MKELPSTLLDALLLTHSQLEVSNLAAVDRAIISKSKAYPTASHKKHHMRAAKRFITDLEAQRANSENPVDQAFCEAYIALIKDKMKNV